MSKKKPILKENSLDGAPGGMGGAVTYSTGWGTYASPAVSQKPNKFHQIQRNTADQQTGGPAGGKSVADNQDKQDELQKDVDKIFQKKDTPTPDEVASAMQFELGRMITKDKSRAKEIVLGNLKKDPHFYSNLHMLNIDDKKMKVDEISRSVNKEKVGKIFQEIAHQRLNRRSIDPKLSGIMQDLISRKEERSFWKRGLTSEAPNES